MSLASVAAIYELPKQPQVAQEFWQYKPTYFCICCFLFVFERTLQSVYVTGNVELDTSSGQGSCLWFGTQPWRPCSPFGANAKWGSILCWRTQSAVSFDGWVIFISIVSKWFDWWGEGEDLSRKWRGQRSWKARQRNPCSSWHLWSLVAGYCVRNASLSCSGMGFITVPFVFCLNIITLLLVWKGVATSYPAVRAEGSNPGRHTSVGLVDVIQISRPTFRGGQSIIRTQFWDFSVAAKFKTLSHLKCGLCVSGRLMRQRREFGQQHWAASCTWFVTVDAFAGKGWMD